ncbi:hypothetical protein [Umezawaea sp. NPDC059074]|uniref:hypothetical protein n=1 Tax=Umezawaea sp. NPDC059074 TaxID=3346716 RepID=UPI00369205BF
MIALLLIAAGLFTAVAASRSWVRQADERSRARSLLARAAEPQPPDAPVSARTLTTFAEHALADARGILMVAALLTLVAVLLVGGGALLYRRATHRPRPRVLDDPRAPARRSGRGTPPAPRPPDPPTPS